MCTPSAVCVVSVQQDAVRVSLDTAVPRFSLQSVPSLVLDSAPAHMPFAKDRENSIHHTSNSSAYIDPLLYYAEKEVPDARINGNIVAQKVYLGMTFLMTIFSSKPELKILNDVHQSAFNNLI